MFAVHLFVKFAKENQIAIIEAVWQKMNWKRVNKSTEILQSCFLPLPLWVVKVKWQYLSNISNPFPSCCNSMLLWQLNWKSKKQIPNTIMQREKDELWEWDIDSPWMVGNGERKKFGLMFFIFCSLQMIGMQLLPVYCKSLLCFPTLCGVTQ